MFVCFCDIGTSAGSADPVGIQYTGAGNYLAFEVGGPSAKQPAGGADSTELPRQVVDRLGVEGRTQGVDLAG